MKKCQKRIRLATAFLLMTSAACSGLQQPNEVGNFIEGPINDTDVASALSVTTRDPNIHIWAEAGMGSFWGAYYNSPTYFTTGVQFSQAFDLIVDMVHATGGRSYTDNLQTLYQNYKNMTYAQASPTVYYDHALMGLALIHASKQMDAIPALQALAEPAMTSARAEFAIVVPGEDTAAKSMFATSAKTADSAASVGAAARLACELYQAQQQASDLAFALRIYNGWHERGLVSSLGQISDTIDTSGTISTSQYTHNYGLMIGAAMCLHRVTGQSSFRDEAILMGNYLLQSMTTKASSGSPYLFEPLYGQGQVPGEVALYKGIAVRYLAELSRSAPDWTDLETLLDGTASTINSSKSQNSQMGSNYAAAPFAGDGLPAQISAMMTLSVLAGDAPGRVQSRLPALVYEAEYATLTGCTQGYTASAGLVVGWNGPQTGITFSVHTPYATSHRLTFIYDEFQQTSRTVIVNGNSTVLPLYFNGISYGPYLPANIDVPLNGGANIVKFWQPTSTGAGDYVNVDKLLLYPFTDSDDDLQIAPLDIGMPISPVDSIGVCGPVRFSWNAVAGAQSYDLVVDEKVIWSGTATTTTLADKALSPGPHVWYTVAFNTAVGTPSAAASFATANAVSAPTNIAFADTKSGLEVTWDAPDPATQATASVRFNGTVRCANLTGQRCLISGVSKTQVKTASLNVALTNICAKAGHSVP